MTLKNDNQRVGSTFKDQELVDLEKKEHTVDKSSSSSRNNIRSNYINNINENNDVNKDKIRINSKVTNINEGDKGSNEKSERYVVTIGYDIKIDNTITLGKNDPMRTVLNEALYVKEDSQYSVPLQHGIILAEQNDSEQYNNPVMSSNKKLTLNKKHQL